MKMAMTTDIHIGLNKNNPNFYKAVENLFIELADVCVREGIGRIAVLGDIFENRRIISQKSLRLAQKVIELCKGIELILVRGNHDTYYEAEVYPNWLTSLRKYDNVTTVEEDPYVSGDFCFVPWAYPIDQLDWRGYLVGHFEISSFQMNDGFECNHGTHPDKFKQFKHVYSGHFHVPSSKGNITYLGTPFQHDFGDVGSTRGYYIFDDGNLEFREFTSAPKFIKIFTDDFERDKHLIKDNYIKLIFNSDYGLNKNTRIVEDAEALSPISIGVDTSRLGQFGTVENEELVQYSDTQEMFKDFLSKGEIPGHLNEKLLYKIVDKLWLEE
jgi:DNA repair exonuclease SbcCD nuclease subunit